MRLASAAASRSRSASERARLALVVVIAGLPVVAESAAQVRPGGEATVEIVDIAEALIDEESVEPLDGALLAELLAEPVDVNRAGIDALSEIPGMNRALARSILASRNRLGPFESAEDLVRRNLLSAELLDEVRTFIRATPVARERPHANARRPRAASSAGRGHVIAQVGRRTDYHGAPGATRVSEGRSDSRFRIRLDPAPAIRVRLAAASSSVGGSPADPSGGVVMGSEDHFLRVSIGDLYVKSGAGLVLGRPALGGASYAAYGPAPSAPDVRLDATTSTRASLRGIAVSIQPSQRLRLIAARGRRSGSYASRRHVPATPASSGGEGTVPSDEMVTPSERTMMLGGWIDGGRFAFGFSGYTTTFDPPVVAGRELYQRHAFSGSRLSSGSLYAFALLPRAQGYLELATSSTGAMAGFLGLQLTYARGTRIRSLFRRYPARFPFHYGHPPRTTNSDGSGEYGWLISMRAQPARRVSVGAFADMFRADWVRRGFGRPISGFEACAEATLRVTPAVTAVLRGSERRRETSTLVQDPSGRQARSVEDQVRHALRLQVDMRLHSRVALRSRLERVAVRVHSEPSRQGILAYHQVRWTPSTRLLIEVRFTRFDAPHYDARLFMHEGDVLYHAALSTMYGSGERHYLRFRFNASNRLTIETKLGTLEALRDCAKNHGACQRLNRFDGRIQVRLVL